jgi:DNA polymerase I-like protein with 3'-5' exonuclease and polymerase domains
MVKRDLSVIENTVTNWLSKNFNLIKEIYTDKLKLIALLERMPEQGVSVSKQKLNEMIQIIKTNSSQHNLQYLYDVYLKGSALSCRNKNQNRS